MSGIANYAELYPLLRVELPGCPDPLLLQECQQYGRRLCRESGIWQETLDAIDTVANQASYALTWTYDADLLHVVWLKYNGHSAPVETDSDYDKNRYSIVPSSGILNTVKFAVAPSAAITDGILVRVALTPKPKTVEIPAWLLERYAEVIANGVKGHLMMMPQKSWSNPSLGLYYTNEWANGLSEAKWEKYKGFRHGSGTMEVPNFV